MSLFEPPFGPLNGIHYLILHHARPIQESSVFDALEALIPLYIQAYLLLSPGTTAPMIRILRAALGIVGIMALTNQFMSWRVVTPGANALNTTLGSLYVHTVLKYVWFAAAPGATDAFMRVGNRRKRSLPFAALDLCLNSRYSAISARDEADDVKDDTRRHRSRRRSPPVKPSFPLVLSTASRAPEALRYLLLGFGQIFVAGALLAIVRTAGPSTLGNPNPARSKLATFLGTTGFELIPGVIDPCDIGEKRIVLPPVVIEVLITVALGAAPYLTMSGLYSLAAGAAVGSGLWESECWQPDLFNSPWKADSLLDFWRRWHALNKHDLRSLTTIALKTAELPLTPFLTIPLSFVISGILHIVYQLGMNPVPSATKVGGFFGLCAAGTLAEYTFYRITGSRVRGPVGRLWAWGFLYVAARYCILDAWVDAGVATIRLAEDRWADALAAWMLQYVLVPYSR
ncbi:hypothetical protein Q8F55_005928 [Vanrija albida]|uniref:Wax synthase domain-containing protein n=1 Tax=Vanrija albida TaxID=181172 RepID=A0ABR3Q2Y6_9TREE